MDGEWVRVARAIALRVWSGSHRRDDGGLLASSPEGDRPVQPKRTSGPRQFRMSFSGHSASVDMEVILDPFVQTAESWITTMIWTHVSRRVHPQAR